MSVVLSPIYKVISGINNVYASGIVSSRDGITCITFSSFKIRGNNLLLSDFDTCEWYEIFKIGVFRNILDTIFVKVDSDGEVTELDSDDTELEKLFIHCPSIYERNLVCNHIEFISSIPPNSRSTTPDSMFARVETPSPKRKRHD
jgi:hypothetical protein